MNLILIIVYGIISDGDMRLFIFIFAALVACTWAEDDADWDADLDAEVCDPFCPPAFKFLTGNITVPSHTVVPISLQFNVTDGDAENITVSIATDDSDMLIPHDLAEIQYEAGVILIRGAMRGGKEFGATKVSIAISWISNGTETKVMIKKAVAVVRPENKHKTQRVLEYLVIGMGLVCALLAACDKSLADLKKWAPYLFIGTSIQLILLPLVSLIEHSDKSTIYYNKN